MKKLFYVIIFTFLACSILSAQQAKLRTEAVTPHRLSSLGLTTNSVSTGLDIVPNRTYIYFCAENIATSLEPILSANFTIETKPSGSAAALEALTDPLWIMLKPDIKGEYKIKLSITTASGTDDTVKTIYAGNFVGVGNYEGVHAQYPNCMSCHGSTPKFINIFDKWKNSGHAGIFKREITTGAAHYSANCIKCHTTGTDHNIAASNNGFDDIALALGWSWQGPPNPGKWDTLKTQFPALVNHATIGCESCHGPGSEHALGGITNRIQISPAAGVCGQCHDEPWRHNKYSEFENSGHSEALWSNSFAQGASSQNNNLQNCIRCHDANGFINFTKGQTTNTTGMVPANHQKVTCSACHDPHGNNQHASLRITPAGSDTLGNGFSYTGIGGEGQLCMNCHKARRDNVTYTASGTVSSHWGPHHSVQADVLLGKNAAEFESSYISGNHKFATANSCVTCHMKATVDTGHVSRDKVGGHSWKLHDVDNNYYHTTGCVSCHGPKNSWDDFMAVADYDGDGIIESIPQEIDGLTALLVYYLPPVGEPTINYQLINTLVLRKAYWNYQLIAYDGSKGMHNTRFAIDVLTKSIIAIGGIIPVELVSFDAKVTGNEVTLLWETASEVNNRGFEVERSYGKAWEKIGFVQGQGTTTELIKYSYVDKPDFRNGSLYYRLKQIDYDGTSSYSKEIEISLDNVPVDFALSQNYPNPFNPVTTIKYTLPVESNVKITLYNVAGEAVKTVVNETMNAGIYEQAIDVSSSSLSSGVYFYTIEAKAVDGSRSFRNTKKMVLLK